MVTVPADGPFWRQVSQGTGLAEGTLAEAADSIHRSASDKADKYSAPHKRKMVLAVDAAHAGVLASSAVMNEYIARHGDPATFGFAGACLVGPIDGRVVWLGTGRI